MKDQPQEPSPAQRECGMCGRVLPLSALTPGWQPVEHRGQLIWRCPDCGRRERLWGW